MKIKNVTGSTLLILTLASCAKQEEKAVVITDVPTPNVSLPQVESRMTHIVKRTLAQQQEETDTLAMDSTDFADIDCYLWEGEIHATTRVMNEVDNSVYDLNVLITLLPSATDHYDGGLVLYTDEENFIEAVIRGEAEGNHITIYYVEDSTNTTEDLFKDGDKLVTCEILDGEYSANWYKPMHRFVNETTVISIQ